MVTFIIFRFIQAVVTLLVTSFAIFALSYTSGSPAEHDFGSRRLPQRSGRQFIIRMGFDKPVPCPVLEVFLKDAVRGEFGTSLRTHAPVTDMVGERLAPSFKLTGLALAITILISLPLGVLGAVTPGYMGGQGSAELRPRGAGCPRLLASPGSHPDLRRVGSGRFRRRGPAPGNITFCLG